MCAFPSVNPASRKRGASCRCITALAACLFLLTGDLSPALASSARDRVNEALQAPLFRGERRPEPRPDGHAPGRAMTMADAVQRALAHNPSLGAQEATSRASEEGRKSARGQFGPKLSLTYQAYKQERESSPSTSSARTPRLGTWSMGVDISQPIFQGFRLLAQYQKAALQAESDRASLRQAELTMTGDVQKAFLAYLQAEENVRSEQDSLARLRDQLRITQAFYDVGLRPRLDVLQAEVDVSDAENLLIQAENTRDTAQAQLNTLVGLPVTARVSYSGSLEHVPFSRSLEQCLAAAYRQRPDLYIAAKTVAIAGKSRQEVQSEYYPKVEAYYNVSRQGNTFDLQRSGENGSSTQVWEVGVSATWDVFQWGTTYYADKQYGWLVTKTRYEEEQLKLDVGYEIKTRLLDVREAEKRIAVARKSVDQATEAYHVALAQYQEQVGTNFDVLNASANLTAAQASLTGAKADYLTALSQLYVAMGEYRPDIMRPEAAPATPSPAAGTPDGSRRPASAPRTHP
ncbi:TolC family protein [uncultured Desulfovibrio sp.]|uniref:TolC family protein n=1 Tax=uncultured Desulfovibrio sp. TaxID=167968 RepID=UPI00261C2EC0|nr:TolC family protein [uncultured Desulfovibrio sp.]